MLKSNITANMRAKHSKVNQAASGLKRKENAVIVSWKRAAVTNTSSCDSNTPSTKPHAKAPMPLMSVSSANTADTCERRMPSI